MGSGNVIALVGSIIGLVVVNFVLIIVFANIINGCYASGLSTCATLNMLWIFLPTIDIMTIWKVIIPLFEDI